MPGGLMRDRAAGMQVASPFQRTFPTWPARTQLSKKSTKHVLRLLRCAAAVLSAVAPRMNIAGFIHTHATTMRGATRTLPHEKRRNRRAVSATPCC